MSQTEGVDSSLKLSLREQRNLTDVWNHSWYSGLIDDVISVLANGYRLRLGWIDEVIGMGQRYMK